MGIYALLSSYSSKPLCNVESQMISFHHTGRGYIHTGARPIQISTLPTANTVPHFTSQSLNIAEPKSINKPFTSDNQLIRSTACPSMSAPAPTPTPHSPVSTMAKIFNATNQLTRLGKKYQIWDNEVSSLQMTVPDFEHAKTGYPEMRGQG
jgi:hypothetical protein